MGDNRPKVGVGVIIKKDNKVLLGKRKNAHGEGTWCFPGGHLEFGEQIEECARREVSEECGILIKDLQAVSFTNDIFEKENKHYITIFVNSDYYSGEVRLMEPEKCERWAWFDWDKIPKPLFIPIQNLLKDGFDPFS